jgi:putative restriction endonuclease
MISPGESALGKRLVAQIQETAIKQRHISLCARLRYAGHHTRCQEFAEILPRLGQGLFRVEVIEAYSRRCAITGERTLPVLEAGHIKPYSLVQRHDVSNGLLLRSDLHRLFDGGYLTIDPSDRRVVVSDRIKEEFQNGKEYYKLEGQVLREPEQAWAKPSLENLEYHACVVFQQ